MAISRRKTLSPAVTDVLIEHGDREVIHATAKNQGARFSETGYTSLVEMAEGDDDLTGSICNRNDVPRHLFLQLLGRASETARVHLEGLNLASKHEIEEAVMNAASAKQAETAILSVITAAARQRVEKLHRENRLDEAQLMAFIQDKDFEAISATLAQMIELPVEVTETLLVEVNSEGLLVVCKAIGLGWPTVAAMLTMRHAWMGYTHEIDLSMPQASYNRLKPKTAQQVLRFYRMRQDAAKLSA
jgi:uncharacterized protein (DUF2336 family)